MLSVLYQEYKAFSRWYHKVSSFLRSAISFLRNSPLFFILLGHFRIAFLAINATLKLEGQVGYLLYFIKIVQQAVGVQIWIDKEGDNVAGGNRVLSRSRKKSISGDSGMGGWGSVARFTVDAKLKDCRCSQCLISIYPTVEKSNLVFIRPRSKAIVQTFLCHWFSPCLSLSSSG